MKLFQLLTENHKSRAALDAKKAEYEDLLDQVKKSTNLNKFQRGRYIHQLTSRLNMIADEVSREDHEQFVQNQEIQITNARLSDEKKRERINNLPTRTFPSYQEQEKKRKKIERAKKHIGSAGYWIEASNGNTRFFKPIFDQHSINDQEGFLPFFIQRNVDNEIGGLKYEAYKLLPKGVGVRDLNKEDTEKYNGIINALKYTGGNDRISPTDLNTLVHKSTEVLIDKTSLDDLDTSSMVMVIPPSSSPVPHMLAQSIKQQLSIPNDNVFFDHLTKRSGGEVLQDVKTSETLDPVVKKRVIKQLTKAHKDLGFDAEVQIKTLGFRGDKKVLFNNGIYFLDIAEEIELKKGVDPTLIIVDDRVSSSHTVNVVRKIFEQYTGYEVPDNRVFILSMFNTSKK